MLGLLQNLTLPRRNQTCFSRCSLPAFIKWLKIIKKESTQTPCKKLGLITLSSNHGTRAIIYISSLFLAKDVINEREIISLRAAFPSSSSSVSNFFRLPAALFVQNVFS